MATYKEAHLLDDIELGPSSSSSTANTPPASLINDSEAARRYPKPTLRRRIATCWHAKLRPRSCWTPKNKVLLWRTLGTLLLLGILVGFAFAVRHAVLEGKGKKSTVPHSGVKYIADRLGRYVGKVGTAKQDAATLPLPVPVPHHGPVVVPQ